MAEAAADTIKAATDALPAFNRYFMVAVAIFALGACALMVWRLEARADAQIAVLQAMTLELHGIKSEQKEQRRAFGAAGIHVRPAAAVAGDAE
jgi:hypothetical protein